MFFVLTTVISQGNQDLLRLVSVTRGIKRDNLRDLGHQRKEVLHREKAVLELKKY